MSRYRHVLVVGLLGILVAGCSGPSNPGEDLTPTRANSVATATATPSLATATAASTETATPTATASPSPSASPTPTTVPSPTATATATPTHAPPTVTATHTPTATVTPTASAGGDEFIIISRDDTSEKTVALTFDAGADRGFAEEILDILAAEGVPATFGMTGHWAEDNPDLILRMVNEGHPLMNHTLTHRSWTGASTGAAPLTSAERAEELAVTEQIVRDIAGVELRPYFRPPYGDYDDSVIADLEANGYSVMVMWTIDSLGWNGLSADEINERVLTRIEPGAIVLLHVGAASQDAAALPQMIEQLRALGYRFVTIPEMVGR